MYSSLYRHICKESNTNPKIITDHIGSTTDNAVFARGHFWDVICKTETASRNQEGECHVSQQINDKWILTGLRKWRVFTAYKAHLIHCDQVHWVIARIRWAGMQDWPKNFLVMLEKMHIMININHTYLESFFSICRLRELQAFEQLVVLPWFFQNIPGNVCVYNLLLDIKAATDSGQLSWNPITVRKKDLGKHNWCPRSLQTPSVSQVSMLFKDFAGLTWDINPRLYPWKSLLLLLHKPVGSQMAGAGSLKLPRDVTFSWRLSRYISA